MGSLEQQPPELSPAATAVEVEVVSGVTNELLDAIRGLTPELASVNQVEVTDEWIKKIVDSDSSTLLAAKDPEGEYRGFAVLVVFPTIVNPRGLVETLVTDPLYRRQGVAEKLIRSALKVAGDKKVNTVRLSTGKDNAASNALFQKLGGVLEHEYNWYDFSLSEGPQ